MTSGSLAAPRFELAAPPPNKILVIGMGDMLAGNDAGATLVTYSLGSCVGVTIYDPVAKVGGLLHAMLPDSSINPARAGERPYMFLDTGLPALFHAVYALGGLKMRLVVKVAGGAQFLDEKKVFNIGERNIEAALSMLSKNGVAIAARETGGLESRTLKLELSTGRLNLEWPGQSPREL